jgi:cardiolipin synthase
VRRARFSKLGIFLDPIADKIMVAAVILMLVHHRERADGWHVIAALVILLREIAVSGCASFLAGIQGVGAGKPTGQVEICASA